VAVREFPHPDIADVAIEDVLHALSDPVRLGVARQLGREGEATCAALDAGRSKSTMAHHFRILRAAGIVQTRGEGVTHWNRLRREELDARFPGLLDAVLKAGGGR
jgi:DNA-binding transcriptional ArsR family regulator